MNASPDERINEKYGESIAAHWIKLESKFSAWIAASRTFAQHDQAISSWQDLPRLWDDLDVASPFEKLEIRIPNAQRGNKEDFVIYLTNTVIAQLFDDYGDTMMFGGTDRRVVFVGKEMGAQLGICVVGFTIIGNTVEVAVTFRNYELRQPLRPLSSDEIRRALLDEGEEFDRDHDETFLRDHDPVGVSASGCLYASLPPFWLFVFLMISAVALLIANPSQLWFVIPPGLAIAWWIVAVVERCYAATVQWARRIQTEEWRDELWEAHLEMLEKDLQWNPSPLFVKEKGEPISQLVNRSQSHRNFLQRMMETLEKIRQIAQTDSP